MSDAPLCSRAMAVSGTSACGFSSAATSAPSCTRWHRLGDGGYCRFPSDAQFHGREMTFGDHKAQWRALDRRRPNACGGSQSHVAALVRDAPAGIRVGHSDRAAAVVRFRNPRRTPRIRPPQPVTCDWLARRGYRGSVAIWSLVRQLRGPHVSTCAWWSSRSRSAVTASMSPSRLPQSSTGCRWPKFFAPVATLVFSPARWMTQSSATDEFCGAPPSRAPRCAAYRRERQRPDYVRERQAMITVQRRSPVAGARGGRRPSCRSWRPPAPRFRRPGSAPPSPSCSAT